MSEFYKGKAKRIEDVDLPRVAHEIGVGEDEIHAILDVESRGRGFDDQGRVIMLFEPHIFYKELRREPTKRNRAVRQGLAYKRWGTTRYPKDSYPRLLKAIKIDREAAIRSCSWGLGQIMGFNHGMVGYGSAEAMVKAFAADEDNHLEAIVDFIVKAGLDDEIRRHDWAGFARGYNGPGYKKHNYHGRLAHRYRKWQGIKDTPWSPDDAAEEEKEAQKPASRPKPPPVPDIKPTPKQPPQPASGGFSFGNLIKAILSAIGAGK